MKKVLGIVLAIVLVPVIIIIICKSCSIGWGAGNGENDNSGSSSNTDNNFITTTNINTEATLPLITTETIQVVTIIVYERTYLYQNHSCELDELMEELSTRNDKFEVEIEDKNATQKACRELIAALKNKGIKYQGPYYD